MESSINVISATQTNTAGLTACPRKVPDQPTVGSSGWMFLAKNTKLPHRSKMDKVLIILTLPSLVIRKKLLLAELLSEKDDIVFLAQMASSYIFPIN